METIHGGGGVEGTRTAGGIVCPPVTARGPAQPASDGSRYQALPASTLSDGEEYAREACADGSPEPITHDYAALAGGF